MRAFELNTCACAMPTAPRAWATPSPSAATARAIDAVLTREIPEIVAGQDADRIESLWKSCGGPALRRPRRPDRAGALGARHGAVGPEGEARRPAAVEAAGRLRPGVPCYAGGIDLDLPLDDLLRQTDDNLAKGFRAIKMKVGRKSLSEDVERVAAMRKHLGDGFPLMADANMKWTRRRGDPRRARLPALRPDLAGGADHPRRRRPATPASSAKAACRSPRARTCARCGSSSS